MRILHLTRTTVENTPGGLEHHVAYLAGALRQRGHEVEVVPTDHVGPNRLSSGVRGQESLSPGTRHPFARSPFASWFSGGMDTGLTLLRRMRLDLETKTVAARVAEFNPDVVHQHAYLGGLAMSWRLAKHYPIVFTNHTGAYLHLNRLWPTRFAQARLLDVFDEIIAPSRELLPKGQHCHYVPNGADPEVFFPVSPDERERLREHWGCQDRFVFFCPRRWAPTKGIIYLARALGSLRPETRARCTFLFAGNQTPGYENYQKTVRSVLASAGCGGDVRILGNLDHLRVAELLNVSDVCVIPSLMEATSLACLEAMACGTPVLGTATGGLLELVEEGRNGWLVPPGNATALARALEQIVRLDHAAREPLRAGALDTMRGEYNWELIAARTERIYLRACLAAERDARRPLSPRRVVSVQ